MTFRKKLASKAAKASAATPKKSASKKSASKKSAKKPATKSRKAAPKTLAARKAALKSSPQVKPAVARPAAPKGPIKAAGRSKPAAELREAVAGAEARQPLQGAKPDKSQAQKSAPKKDATNFQRPIRDENGERYGEAAPDDFNSYVADETGRSPEIMGRRPDGAFGHASLIKSRSTFRIRWVSKALNYSDNKGGETKKKRLVGIRLTCGDNSFRHALIFLTDAKYLDALREDCEAGYSQSNFRLEGGERGQSKLVVTSETTLTNEPPDDAAEAAKSHRLDEISLTPERLARIKRPDVVSYAEEMSSLYGGGLELIRRNEPVEYYNGWGETPRAGVYPTMYAFTPSKSGGALREVASAHVSCEAMVRDSPNANQPTYDTIYTVVSARSGVERHTVSNAKEFDKNSSPLKNILAQYGYSSTNSAHFEAIFSALKSEAPDASTRRDFVGWTPDGDLLMCDMVLSREGERSHAQAGIFPPRNAPARYTAALRFNPSIELKAEFLRRVTTGLYADDCAAMVLGVLAYSCANLIPRFDDNGEIESATEAGFLTGVKGAGKNCLLSIFQGLQGGGFTALKQGPQLASASTAKHRGAVASDYTLGLAIGADFKNSAQIADKNYLKVITTEIDGRFDAEESGYLSKDQTRNLRARAHGGALYTCEEYLTPILCEHGFSSTAVRFVEFHFPAGATPNLDTIEWLTDDNPADGRWPRGMTAAHLRWPVGRDFVSWIMRQHGDAAFAKYWNEARSEVSRLQRGRTDVARVADNRCRNAVVSLLTGLHFFRQFLTAEYGEAAAETVQWINVHKSDLVTALADRASQIAASLEPSIMAERHHQLLLDISAEIGSAVYFEPTQGRDADRGERGFMEQLRARSYALSALGLMEHLSKSRTVLKAANPNAMRAGWARFKNDGKLYLIISDRFSDASALVRFYAKYVKELASVKIDGRVIRCFFERLNSTPVKGGLEIEFEALIPTPGFVLEELRPATSDEPSAFTPRPAAAAAGFAMANGKKSGLPN
jgi:hypothetical protein